MDEIVADDFAALGIDERLVGKLMAESGAGAGASAGAVAGSAAVTAVGGVVRGHLRDGFGLLRPTRVQRLMVPAALRGRSLLVKSETGSGKTLAFLLPIVHGLLQRNDAAAAKAQGASSGAGLDRAAGTFAIILAPTRELCQQIFGVATRLLQPFPTLVPGLVAGGEKRKSEKVSLGECTPRPALQTWAD